MQVVQDMEHAVAQDAECSAFCITALHRDKLIEIVLDDVTQPVRSSVLNQHTCASCYIHRCTSIQEPAAQAFLQTFPLDQEV